VKGLESLGACGGRRSPSYSRQIFRRVAFLCIASWEKRAPARTDKRLHREQRICDFRFLAVGRRLRKLFWLVAGIALTSGIGFMMPKN
jgi:hypothetical protein